MTDFKLLQDVINESQLTITALARLSGIKRETLYNRFKGKGEFTASEIAGLTRALKLKKPERDAIFFSV